MHRLPLSVFDMKMLPSLENTDNIIHYIHIFASFCLNIVKYPHSDACCEHDWLPLKDAGINKVTAESSQ